MMKIAKYNLNGCNMMLGGNYLSVDYGHDGLKYGTRYHIFTESCTLFANFGVIFSRINVN